MRWSQGYIPTVKEAPNDAEVISHKLLIRSGMIRKITSGIYTWLPLGLKSLNKIIHIIRKEMDNAGVQEIFMPMVQPADLWLESGRWEQYGKELLRFKDRHDRDYCLGPTHEEVMTDLIRGEVRSYKQLPLSFYQIQTKFRDEIRPRFGLMRGREFLMKDAYSFDCDEESANKSYWKLFDAYKKIFTSFGLNFRAVSADSGSIGGSFSHEFTVLADTGEDSIAYCSQCDWASNVELAEIFVDTTIRPSALCPPKELVDTPKVTTINDVKQFLLLSENMIIKTVLYSIDDKPVAVLVRGDREVNEVKLKNYYNAKTVVMANSEQVQRWTGSPVGFVGPVNFTAGPIIADQELISGTDWVVGANQSGKHFKHVDLSRDASNITFADIRMITPLDTCPLCKSHIEVARGIEVGHIFKLGTKYSSAMNAKFLDAHGKEQNMIMGCYGIGVSRVLAACIEQNNDSAGIVFPAAIAPFDCILVNLDPRDPVITDAANSIYEVLCSEAMDVLMDDREERPGIKFKDADLIGIPLQIILGAKAFSRGYIEVKNRKTGEKTEIPFENFFTAFDTWKKNQ